MTRVALVPVLLLAALGAAGCSDSQPTGPKPDLNETERKQVRELDEHRHKEWGGK